MSLNIYVFCILAKFLSVGTWEGLQAFVVIYIMCPSGLKALRSQDWLPKTTQRTLFFYYLRNQCMLSRYSHIFQLIINYVIHNNNWYLNVRWRAQAQTRENGTQVINPHVWLTSIPMAHIHFFELKIELTLQYCGPYLNYLVKPLLALFGEVLRPLLEGELKLEFEKMAVSWSFP